jgi:transcriptional regulator with XRE-family HTH domain
VAQVGRHQIVCAEVVRLLRQERQRRKLSCYALSRRSGVSQSMLSLVERGLRNPTLDLLLRIADGLEVDLSTFLKKAEMIPPKSKRK